MQMQLEGDPALSSFAKTVVATVDEQLLMLIRNSNKQEDSTTNIDFLLNKTSEMVMKVLHSTPAELSATWILFLNRYACTSLSDLFN